VKNPILYEWLFAATTLKQIQYFMNLVQTLRILINLFRSPPGYESRRGSRSRWCLIKRGANTEKDKNH